MSSKHESKRSSRRRRGLAIAAASVVGEFGVLRSRGYGFGGTVVVRCRDGHLFTTIWIPGASVKSLRLGPWRVQRCPVGNHWSIVTPVKRSELSDDELALAAQHRDVRIP
ncbi:MAG TPA: hypothetical protein VG410_11340 [Solirubrobacteraceae bacterium]|nr:hypothetical protein [Solirubrobacteraceae bacterium]